MEARTVSDSPQTSPNEGRKIQAAIRKARLPLLEKALLTQLGLSYHAESRGCTAGRDSTLANMGTDVTAEQFEAARARLVALGAIATVKREGTSNLTTFDLDKIKALALAPAGGAA